jgi:hypothetical protein
MAKGSTKPNPRKLLFVQSYLETMNATKAAVAAGYSAKTAAQIGSRLLRKDPWVKAEVERRTKGVMAKVEKAAEAAIQNYAVTAENIIGNLAKMGLAHEVLAKFLRVTACGDLEYDFRGATPEDLAAIAPMIQEIKTDRFTMGRGEDAREVIRSTVKMVERRAVLELLGRYSKLALWKDRFQVESMFDEMTPEELREYAEKSVLPERFKSRLQNEGAA